MEEQSGELQHVDLSMRAIQHTDHYSLKGLFNLAEVSVTSPCSVTLHDLQHIPDILRRLGIFVENICAIDQAPVQQ